MRCGNTVRWKAMPSHLTWITLRVIHIPTTTAAADSLRILNPKTKERRAFYRKLLTLLLNLISNPPTAIERFFRFNALAYYILIEQTIQLCQCRVRARDKTGLRSRSGLCLSRSLEDILDSLAEMDYCSRQESFFSAHSLQMYY